MSVLSVTFDLIDKMSDKFDKMANSGERAFEQWERAGEIGDEAFENTAKAAERTAQAMDSASQSTDHWTEKIGNYDKGAMEAIYSTEELVEMGYKTADALEEAAGGAEEFGDELNDAGDQADEFGKKSVNSIEMLEDVLVAAGITKLLSAIGEAFISCAEDSIEFESAITGVYKTVDGTPEQLAAISDEVKELSLRIPSTTTEIAGVAEAAGQLGIVTDDIMSFTEVMINLGEATNLSSDEAATSLAKFANITKMEAENYENLGSTVVALGNNFATTEADIVAMSMRMASAGELAGMSEPQIMALAASLSSVGIEADAGGSSMSTLLSKMQLAAETGSAELEQFASVSGMTSEEFQRQWSEDAVTALYAFIAGLNDTERNGASATAVLDEMGITEIRLSNAVKSLANNHEGLADAIALADDAWAENNALANEANTRYATLESRLDMAKNAANNLSIAVGDDLSNAVSSLLPAGTTIINGITTVVEKCPAVTAVVVGLVGGLGALTLGVTAYTAVTKYATLVTQAFDTALSATGVGTIIKVVSVVAALAGGLIVLAANTEKAVNEYDTLTSACQAQHDELQALKAEYESICDVYGETSYQAQELSWKIEELEARYESSKQTMEEYRSSFDETMQSYYDMVDQHEESANKVDMEAESITELANRLGNLASQTELSAAEQEEMRAIITALNEEVPGLSLSYDDLANSVPGATEAVLALAEAEAKRRQYDEKNDQLIEKMSKRAELEQNLTNATNNQAAAYQDYLDAAKAYNDYVENHRSSLNTTTGAKKLGGLMADVNEAAERYNQFTADVEEANKAIEDNEAAIESTAEEMAVLSGRVIEGADNFATIGDVINSTAAQVEALVTAYNEAYNAAVASFEGQFGLFDQAEADAEATVGNMQKALDSQLAYWETYAGNIEVLKGQSADALGMTEENYQTLMALVQEGTPQAAGMAQSLVDAINSGNTEAIAKISDTMTKVETARQTAAADVAAWKTDFDNKMNEIVQKMETSMTELDMSTEATTAAANTMKAYAQSVLTNGATAVTNAKSIAAQIKSALEGASATVNVGVTGGGKTGTGYATGTDFATPGWHLVGEEGPEIVEFAGGETVYPADETARMLASMRPTPLNTNVPESLTGQKTEDVTTKDKRIVVAIEGGGEISVKGDVDKNTVVELLVSNLKPVLLNMLQEEILEEGDGSYEY